MPTFVRAQRLHLFELVIKIYNTLYRAVLIQAFRLQRGFWTLRAMGLRNAWHVLALELQAELPLSHTRPRQHVSRPY